MRSAPAWSAVVLILSLNAGWAAAADGPRYASPATRSAVLAMVEAHGDLERWRSARTVSFTRRTVFAANPDAPWLLQETIEQGSRRLYQHWPLDDVQLASDGETVWTVGWRLPFPPRFVAQIGFYFLNLPWITQDDGVILGEVGQGTPPGSETAHLTVPMSFAEGIGDTPLDRYVLFIDPETSRLAAVEYHVSYGAMLDAAFLPPAIRTMGPFVHVNEEFARVDGFVVPVAYSVYSGTGARSMTGEVSNWSFTKGFDATRLEPPADAVIDTSNPVRRSGS